MATVRIVALNVLNAESNRVSVPTVPDAADKVLKAVIMWIIGVMPTLYEVRVGPSSSCAASSQNVALAVLDRRNIFVVDVLATNDRL